MRLGSVGLRIIVLLLLIILPLALGNPARASPPLLHSLLPYDPIWILGDSAFTAVNGVVSGSGSPEDPYIIEGWDITVVGSNVFFAPGSTAGILVENTQAHFIIREVLIHDGPDTSANIVLKNVVNGRVESSRAFNGNIGILLWFTNNSIVSTNEIADFGIGLELSHSFGNLLKSNSIREIGWPIFALGSSENSFLENIIEMAGRGVSLNRNSSFNIFRGNIIQESLWGVSVALDSHSNLISGNHIKNVELGIGVGPESRGNTVEGNVVAESGLGVLLDRAFETRVQSNRISASTRFTPPGRETFSGKGVWVFESSHNWVTGNTILAPVGIALCGSTQTFIAPPPNDLSGTERRIAHVCP